MVRSVSHVDRLFKMLTGLNSVFEMLTRLLKNAVFTKIVSVLTKLKAVFVFVMLEFVC